MQARAKARRIIGAFMEERTRLYRMEANTGVDLDAEN
jgi:hypothetical protein